VTVLDDVDILKWLDQEEAARPRLEVRSANTNTLTSDTVTGTCFEIQREVLLSLLEKAIGVVPTRDMIPVYTNFQFRVAEDQLQVVASSQEMSIVVSTTQIQTKVTGVEVFPARTLLAIIKETSVGTSVYIEVTASGAVIVAGSFSAEIRMSSGKGFPTTANLKDVVFHQVNRIKFIDAITTVKYALPGKDYSGQDTMRMINIKGGKFTACDGSRFQQTRIEDFKLSLKLPTFSINSLLKILSSSDQEMLEIGEVKGSIVFRLDNTIFYMNKLDDPYPNVEQLWLRPALSNDQELRVNRQQLITAIKQVKIAADSDSNAIAMLLEDNQIKVVAKDTNNSASAIIPCVWDGKPRTIVVNYTHLAEMLKAYNQSECQIFLGEDAKGRKAPILLKDSETQAIATISQMVAYRAGLTG